jgi:Glu-tRNA(Gln) amidotransferase subunit E-like FAD-binding protein
MDYKKLGLKSGLEIHQQLDTHKLFCRCPSILKQADADIKIKRKLKAVSGELGKVDEAASFEQQKDKEFIYEFYKDSNCLVELDEEPPHEINEDALKIAIQISLLLNCKIIPIAQVMRKTVIDGSNTSGFQRTMLLAKDGFIETSQGKVGIDYVMLEEDAARASPSQVSSNNTTNTEEDLTNYRVFRLDRLGIPLVEIATKPDLKTAEQIKEAALKIGEILRACKVKRGIGTIRQDLNISIEGSKRVEIKGFQDPRIMIQTVDQEIQRQQKCIKEKSCKNEVRKVLPDGSTSFLRPLPGSSRMYPETDLPLIRITNEMIKEAKKGLPKLKEEISLELKEQGLNPEMTKLILQENKLHEFKALIKLSDKPNLAAKLLVLLPKEIASHEKIEMKKINEKLSLDIIETIFQAIIKNKIPESSAKQIMIDIIQGSDINELLEQTEKQLQAKPMSLETDIQQIIKEKPGLSLNAYMGLVMQKFKGKVDAKQVSEILKLYVK